MNLTTTKINLRRALFSSATLASMLGGIILTTNNPAQAEQSVQKQGSQTYIVGNKSGIGVNYEIQYINKFGELIRKKDFVGFNEQDRFVSLNTPLVIYDSKIGPGYSLKALPLTPGNNNFDRTLNNSLIFTNGDNGAVSNSVPGDF